MRLEYAEGSSDLSPIDPPEIPTDEERALALKRPPWDCDEHYDREVTHYLKCPVISRRDEWLLRFGWLIYRLITGRIENYICLKYEIPQEWD